MQLSEPEDPDLVKLRELGLDIGARLEVMWDVEDNDVSTTYVRRDGLLFILQLYGLYHNFTV
jgi:hypothetical protein